MSELATFNYLYIANERAFPHVQYPCEDLLQFDKQQKQEKNIVV